MKINKQRRDPLWIAPHPADAKYGGPNEEVFGASDKAAEIRVHGVLTKYDQWVWHAGTGQIRMLVQGRYSSDILPDRKLDKELMIKSRSDDFGVSPSDLRGFVEICKDL